MGDEKDSLWIGFDIGATKILGLAATGSGRILKKKKIETLRDQGPGKVMERVFSLYDEMVRGLGQPVAVGAGFAGLVDAKAGKVMSSIMLPGWDGYPLAETLSRKTGKQVFIENDATAAGIGEYRARGSIKGLNMLMLTVGTGIGGAIILDGKLYKGASGIAGEFGNTTIDWHGKKCWCGSFGCLNMLASGSAISEAALELSNNDGVFKGRKERPSLKEVAEAAENGDSPSARAIEQGARALGAGLANFINIFNPHLIVLTGGVTALGEKYLETVREEAGARAFSEAFREVSIEVSVLGNDVGAFGAACLAMEAAGKKGG